MVTYLILIVWLSSPLLVMILAFAFGARPTVLRFRRHPRIGRSYQPVLPRLFALQFTWQARFDDLSRRSWRPAFASPDSWCYWRLAGFEQSH